MEEYCLQLILSYPELREQAGGLRPEFFTRHENRELFTRWLDVASELNKDNILTQIKRNGDDEISNHLDLLLEKPMIASDANIRSSEIAKITSRLEERNLKAQKSEEVKMFTDSPPDVEDDENGHVLKINERIKNNEGLRRGQTKIISG